MRSNGRGKSLWWRVKNIWLDTVEHIGDLKMQIATGSFEFKMVWNYIQGTFRFYFPELVRKRVMRQIEARYDSLRETCRENEACDKCGCNIPEVMYCDKGCHCYPKISYK